MLARSLGSQRSGRNCSAKAGQCANRENSSAKRLPGDAGKPRASSANEMPKIRGKVAGQVHLTRNSRAVAKPALRHAKRQVGTGFPITFFGVAFNGSYSGYNAGRCRIVVPAQSSDSFSSRVAAARSRVRWRPVDRGGVAARSAGQLHHGPGQVRTAPYGVFEKAAGPIWRAET